MSRWLTLLAPPAPGPRPSRILITWLFATFILALFPHLFRLPIWVTLGVVLCLSCRFVLDQREAPLPSAAFCAVLAICLFAAVWLQFHSIFGLNPGAALMAGLLAIKFLELRGRREVSLIAYSSFFLVMSALLYSQELELFLYCLLMLWLLCALLMRTHAGDRAEQTPRKMLARSGQIALAVMPLGALLFFVCPRYQGQIGMTDNDTLLGLTDHVAPGDVAQLARTDAEAFRVRFAGGIRPSPATMYWRGLVLWDYQGGVWDAGTTQPARGPLPMAAPGSQVIGQDITLQPHQRRWLFALDSPISLPGNPLRGEHWSEETADNTVRLSNPREALDELIAYSVVSAPVLRPRGGLTADEEKHGSRLPINEISPRVRALAASLEQGCTSAESYSQAILAYFRREHFVYTASPGQMGSAPLDAFLFKRKAGFCEHFASAYAILMRLGASRWHCPARLVVGYFGGEFNPYGGFYLVQQADAHAWDEVWFDQEKRWVRVDPTMAVQPGFGGLSTIGGAPSDNGSARSSEVSQTESWVAAHQFSSWLRHGWREWLLRREQVEAGWEDWVTSYDATAQDRLLAQAESWAIRYLPWVIAGALALSLLALGLVLWSRRRATGSRCERIYHQLCRRLARRGAPRAAWEAPLAYTARAARFWPEQEHAVRQLGQALTQLRYGAPARHPKATLEIIELWHQLRGSLR